MAIAEADLTVNFPPFGELELDPHTLADLRSDHAGESGAVAIYRGILAVTKNPELRQFAEHHLATEQRHLAAFDGWLPAEHRSRLLPVWRLAGWLTGALPALFGPRGVYVTIEAVERFVVQHYEEQIRRMETDPAYRQLSRVLARFCADEDEHRRDAQSRTGGHGIFAKMWRRLVGAGSAAGVTLARRI